MTDEILVPLELSHNNIDFIHFLIKSMLENIEDTSTAWKFAHVHELARIEKGVLSLLERLPKEVND